MRLEEQIETMARFGLPLNNGIAIDDLLFSESREEYEMNPFGYSLLFTYGGEVEREPWGRFFCDRAWNLDCECIDDPGSYTNIVEQFHRISGRTKPLEDLSDQIDWSTGKASLRYTIGEQRQELDFTLNDDWADAGVVATIKQDTLSPGFEYYELNHGQNIGYFHMTPKNAQALNAMTPNLFGLKKLSWWKRLAT